MIAQLLISFSFAIWLQSLSFHVCNKSPHFTDKSVVLYNIFDKQHSKQIEMLFTSESVEVCYLYNVWNELHHKKTRLKPWDTEYNLCNSQD